MTFIEKLSSGIEIVHEGPPPETHGHECWRVHHECAVRMIEAYHEAIGERETHDGYNDPDGLKQILKRYDERIGELLRRLGDVCR